MKILAFFTFLLSTHVFAQKVDGVGIRSINPNLNSYYTIGKKEVDFQTNSSAGTNITLLTSWFDFGVTFQGGRNNQEGIKQSRYHDFFLKTQIKDFELTYHQAEFVGANINEGPLTEKDIFFEDYKVKKQLFRVTHYFNHVFNRVLNNPKAARKERALTGSNYISSWLGTVGYVDTLSKFPKLNQEQSESMFGFNSINSTSSSYIENLETKNLFYSVGYAGLHMLTTNFTYDFKISFGNGFQVAKYTQNGKSQKDDTNASYMEWDFGLNYLINETHNIGLRGESYQNSVKIGDAKIDSSASQVAVFYQYFI